MQSDDTQRTFTEIDPMTVFPEWDDLGLKSVYEKRAEMPWQEKLAVLEALTTIELKRRHDGTWYVRAPGREVKQGSFLRGEYGEGPTPEAAIEDDWRRITAASCVVIGAYTPGRREYRWNGYRWADA